MANCLRATTSGRLRASASTAISTASGARVFGELFCAFGEYGLRTRISAYVFVTSAALIDSALLGAGVVVQRLGKLNQCGRPPMIAARSPVSYSALHRLRRHHGISGPVLRLAGEAGTRAA